MPGRGYRGGFGGRRSFGGKSRAAGRSSGRSRSSSRTARRSGRSRSPTGTWSPTRSTTPGESVSTWVQPITPSAGPPSMRGTADYPAAESWWWNPGRCPGGQPRSWRLRRSRVTGAGHRSCQGTTGRPTASTIVEVRLANRLQVTGKCLLCWPPPILLSI